VILLRGLFVFLESDLAGRSVRIAIPKIMSQSVQRMMAITTPFVPETTKIEGQFVFSESGRGFGMRSPSGMVLAAC